MKDDFGKSYISELKRTDVRAFYNTLIDERGRKLVNYKEGAEIYGIPYYSFVRLAKEAGASYTPRKAAVIDIDVIEQYLDEHPEVAMRVISVRKV